MENTTTKAEIVHKIYQLNDEARRKYTGKKLRWIAPPCIRGIKTPEAFIGSKRYEKYSNTELRGIVKQLHHAINVIK